MQLTRIKDLDPLNLYLCVFELIKNNSNNTFLQKEWTLKCMPDKSSNLLKNGEEWEN